MNLADYLDRELDLSAFYGIFPNKKRQLLVQQLVSQSSGGELVAGVQKLAQKILLILLTIKGSKPYRPADGTLFIEDARRGAWRTVADVNQSFLFAKIDIREQVLADETASTPADERYGNVRILGVTLIGTKVSFTLEVKSAAGSRYKFLVPLGVVLR